LSILGQKICVIIPTRDRVASLRALILSLESAETPADWAVEIIAVNNGSSDGTLEMLQEESARENRYPLRVLNQPQPGKSRALNMALANCDGGIVLIFDDDVTADPQCLAKHLEAYQRTGFAAVQGKVLPGKDRDGRSAMPERLREYNIPHIDHGEQIIEIRGLTGTNMSFKREVLERVGSFDVRLGPGASGFSEDTEFSKRVRAAGFKIGYTPHAIVYHELSPARYGRAYHRDVQYRKGISRSIYRTDSIAFKVLPRLWGHFCNYCLSRMLGQRAKAYRAEGRMLKAYGYVMGKLGRARSRRS